MKNIINTGVLASGGGKPSSNATLRGCIKRFFESIKTLCHPEFISGSHQREKFTLNFYEILKQVQNDIKSLFTTHNSLVKAVAFTLAETLVVMGIIGVVAALTIPNLNQSTGDREKVAKLKKIYSNLEDAYGRATAVYGPIDEWFANDTTYDAKETRFKDRITEFLKVSKVDKDNDTINLADGSELYFWINYDGVDFQTSSSYPDLQFFGVIYVDLDGPNKGKNQPGYDTFNFVITDQGIFPDDTAEKNGEDSPAYYDERYGDDYYATAWVIMNGNMDYLKCFDDLSWNGQTSCK